MYKMDHLYIQVLNLLN